MSPTDTVDRIVDPIEAINTSIEKAWRAVCRAYDESACLPEMQVLFDGADLSRPNQAAETVIVNMLMEVIENVGRFSPWYKRSARAFGLTSVREGQANRVRWLLAPEAVQKWQEVIAPLATVIRKYNGLIRAMVLVDDLMQDIPGDPCVTARCGCNPPHVIQLRLSVLAKTEIICETCMQPYT
jgi:hypothetical protein